MNEIQAEESVLVVFDATVKMRAAAGTGMTLNRRAAIDDRQLVAIRRNGYVVAGNNGNHGEFRVVRFPAFRTTTNVIVERLGADRYFDLIRCTQALQGTARKAVDRCGDTVVDGGVYVN